MKKNYTKPVVEKIEFDYTIATTSSGCGIYNTYAQAAEGCTDQPTGSYGNPTQAA